MLISRFGNKERLAKQIIQHFPKHDIFIDLFFGAGGIFFNKPLAKYNILNDLDAEIINVFKQILTNKDKLYEFIEIMPYHQDLPKYLKEYEPKNDIERAGIYLTTIWNFKGNLNTILVFNDNFSKKNTLQNIIKIYKFLVNSNTQFLSTDFRKVLNFLNFRRDSNRERTFIYADPPYLNTSNNYNTPEWTEEDFLDLIKIMKTSGMKMAISEYYSPFIEKIVKENNFYLIFIKSTQSMRREDKDRHEVLITNYRPQLTLF